MGILLGTKCLNALQRKEDLCNTSSWRAGVVLVPPPHFTHSCFCKVLQTLIFNRQNPCSSSSECLGNWLGVMSCVGNGCPYSALKGYICFMQQCTANSSPHPWQLLTLRWVWGSLVQQDHCPGLQQHGAVRRCQQHSGCPEHCPGWVLHLTVLLQCLTALQSRDLQLQGGAGSLGKKSLSLHTLAPKSFSVSGSKTDKGFGFFWVFDVLSFQTKTLIC